MTTWKAFRSKSKECAGSPPEQTNHLLGRIWKCFHSSSDDSNAKSGLRTTCDTETPSALPSNFKILKNSLQRFIFLQMSSIRNCKTQKLLVHLTENIYLVSMPEFWIYELHILKRRDNYGTRI